MKENELRDRAYQIAVAHGWHDFELPKQHFLMMIITEIAEAVQADRKNRYAERESYIKLCDYADREKKLKGDTRNVYKKEAFEINIKDSFEDELADICIRCYDLAGLLKWDIDLGFDIYIANEFTEGDIENITHKSVTEFMLIITQYLAQPQATERNLVIPLYLLAEWAAVREIPLLWYIKEKMKYNENRPFKHNCKY